MEWLKWIITIGSAASAIILLWKLVSSFVRALDTIKNDVMETKSYVMDNLKNVEEIPTIKEHLKETYITGLRLTIMNSEMPIGERIAAGIKYLDDGQNGEVKKYLIEELHINDVIKH